MWGTLAEEPESGLVGDVALMLDNLAAPGAALTLALAFVLTASVVGVVRTRPSPDQCARLCIVLLVLTLTMAASVVVFRPLQAGDFIDAQEPR